MKNLRFSCAKASFTCGSGKLKRQNENELEIKIRFQIYLGTCRRGFYAIKWAERGKQSKPNSQPSVQTCQPPKGKKCVILNQELQV